MRVAVIDVGSNTIRLLVAATSGDGLATIEERQSRIGLGAEIETQGRISEAKINESAATVRDFVAATRKLGCTRLVVAVTSPGRQAENAAQLIACLEEEAPLAVKVLSGAEEAQFAWEGALSWCGPSEGSVLVCDVGGGSTELAFGIPAEGLQWRCSLDIGSLRLTRRLLVNDPPGKKLITAARAEIERELDGLRIPIPVRALAVGGSARAVGKIAGKSLGAEQFSEALRVLRRWPSVQIATEFKIDPIRAGTVAAGALILAELHRRIAVPFEVAPRGLREGLALSLIARRSAA